jgi:hypothetical protein
MAYTITRSDGTVLTSIQDGTLDTTSTSLQLPGRNYAGYGQSLDNNFVKQLESYAGSAPPNNPLRGQLWYDTVTGALKVCPADGTTIASSWLTLTSSNAGNIANIGTLTATGNLNSNNINAVNAITGDTITVRLATVSDTLSAATIDVTTGAITTLTSTQITTGAATTAGTLTGAWTVNGNNMTGGNALSIASGNISFATSSVNGIKCDNYMYANGASFNPSGTYTNQNVSDYLTGANAVTRFTGNIKVTEIDAARITGGGMIKGTWTIDSANGASLQATYADLAERFEADSFYDVGTVVELGGEKEVTAVSSDSSEDVFGVVSGAHAYLMNSGAGNNKSHPPIAMSGRVPVKVVGKVKKGQRLVAAGIKGYARAASRHEITAFNVIGRALSNKTTDGAGTIEAIVTISK